MPKTEKTRSPKKGSPRRASHPVPGLIGSLLQFNLAKETEKLWREDPWNTMSRNAKTLVKYADLHIVLIAMQSGIHMERHRADGSISIHVLTGNLRLHLDDQIVEVPAGRLLTLERDLAHEVEAMEDSSFLLTISWPRGVRTQEVQNMLYRVKSQKTLAEVVKALEESAQKHKFGVLAVHDLRQKMKDKGVEFDRDCLVYEVCDPQQAKKVLEANTEISTALPCRISVYREGEGITLATIRPTVLLNMFNVHGLRSVAEEVEHTMLEIMDEAAK